MKIRKALITAAGPNQRRLPLQTLTDRDGTAKPALVIMLQELKDAGLSQVGLVLSPGDADAYLSIVAPFGSFVQLLEQTEPRGYGHAVLSGQAFIGDEPFLLQVSDHLFVSHGSESCTRQLLNLAESESCSISAVQPTHESHLRFYGTVAGQLLPGRAGLYQVEAVLEKPSLTVAEQQCAVQGLRAGHYLCFFGLHVLTPTIFKLLGEDANGPGKLGLSPALAKLAARESYLAAEITGRRADLEAAYGFLRAQLALGLASSGRDEILALLAEELALNASARR